MTSGDIKTPPPGQPGLPQAGKEPPKPQGVTSKVFSALKGLLPGSKKEAAEVKKPLRTIPPAQEKAQEATKSVPLPKIGLHRVPQNQLTMVNNLLKFLDTKGYETEGIFRISGSGPNVRELKGKLEKNPQANISDNIELHDAMGALKAIWEEVAFDPSVGQKLVEFAKTQSLDVSNLKDLPLTKPQREILDKILDYAVKVAKNSEVNKMPTANIAMVLAPVFLPKTQDLDPLKMLTDNAAIINALTTILNHNANPNNRPFKFS